MPADLTPAEIEAMRLRASGEPPCSALPPHTPLEDDLSADVMRLLAVVDALTARLAEAEATLANERGRGSPPSDGWMWNMHARYWFRPGMAVHWADMGRAWWWSDSHGTNASDPRCGPHATARAAMKAADAAKVTPCPLPCPTCGYNGVRGTTHSTSCLYPTAKEPK